MPRSKHRRKPGGKAVAHPGRGKTRELPLSPEDVLWRRFVDGYTRPFHEKYALIPTALNTDSLAPVYRIEKTGDSRPLRESTVRAVGITAGQQGHGVPRVHGVA
jgi:hypothetical protein